MVCPICNTKTEKENQEYCLNCAWEFEYFFNELSEEEKKRYNHKLQIHRSIYEKPKNELKNDKNENLDKGQNPFTPIIIGLVLSILLSILLHLFK